MKFIFATVLLTPVSLALQGHLLPDAQLSDKVARKNTTDVDASNNVGTEDCWDL
ncbi:hypothetical protein VTH82DRAFT_5980 [Thermothelomyces myriococcoides]